MGRLRLKSFKSLLMSFCCKSCFNFLTHSSYHMLVAYHILFFYRRQWDVKLVASQCAGIEVIRRSFPPSERPLVGMIELSNTLLSTMWMTNCTEIRWSISHTEHSIVQCNQHSTRIRLIYTMSHNLADRLSVIHCGKPMNEITKDITEHNSEIRCAVSNIIKTTSSGWTAACCSLEELKSTVAFGTSNSVKKKEWEI